MRFRTVALFVLLFSAELLFGQATFNPVALGFPQIAVGGDSGGQNYVTLIQIVNNNSASTTGHISLFSDSGSPLPVLFDGQGPLSTMDVTLTSGETRQIQLSLNGGLQAGWMLISYTPNDALTSVILQFRSGTTLLSEVGVEPAFDTFAATDFAAETDAGAALNTGIAIDNPSSGTAYVLATLYAPSTGAVSTSTILTLPANGHIARFLTDLFPNALNISQTRAKVALDACANSSCTQAGGNGFLATAIRLNGDQFTTIPLVDRPPDGDQTRVLPQVAFGGPADGLNMKTVLYFTTNVASGVFGTIDIFDNDGNPLKASADGATPSSTFTFTVPGNRVSRIVLSGDSTLRSGWLRLTLSSNVHLMTNAIFQTFIGPNLTSEASVLESVPNQRGLIYVSTRSGASNIGLAFANPDTNPNTITLTLFNKDGFVFATKDVTLPPNGHAAQFVTEIFPQLGNTNFDGALSVYSPSPFSALALRLSADKIATLPVAADGMYRPAVTGLRVSSAARAPAQVNFAVDFTDFDSDVATSAATSVNAVVYVDFGNVGYDFGNITMDGTAVLNRNQGTLTGSFSPRVSGTVPSGYPATLYIILYDSAGNASNFVSLPFKF